MKRLRLSIPLENNSLPLDEVLHLGSALVDQVRKAGGRARCIRLEDAVIVEQVGMDTAQVQRLVDSFAEAMIKRREELCFALEEVSSEGVDLDSDAVLPGEYVRCRLTKKLLFSLPAGAFVVSNLFESGVPVYAFEVGTDMSDRGAKWRDAVEAGVAQRTCDVLWSSSDVLECHGIDFDSL